MGEPDLKKKFLIVFLYLLFQATAPRLVLTWLDNSDDETGFLIERTLSENCLHSWEVIGYTGPDQNSFVDNHFPGACYRIAAFNEHGLSPYTNTVKAPVEN